MTMPAVTLVPARTQGRPILVVSNVIVSPRGEILLGRRADCGLWESPGGKVEAESVADAGRREQKEESGMTLKGEPYFLGYTDGWEWSGVAGRQWYVCLMLLWTEYEGFPQLVEGAHTEWRWFPAGSLPPLAEMTFGTRKFFERFPGPAIAGLTPRPTPADETPWQDDETAATVLDAGLVVTK